MLNKGTPSPLAKESDEEKGEAAEKDEKKEDEEKREEAATARRGYAAEPGARRCRTDGREGRRGKNPKKRAGRDRPRRLRPPHRRPSRPRRDLGPQAGRRTRSASSARPTAKSSLQHFDFKDRKEETILPRSTTTSLVRRQEDPLPAERVGERSRCGKGRGRSSGRPRRRPMRSPTQRPRRTASSSTRSGEGRPARRVAADLRRGLAHQPRLLLRPEHARRRLGRDEGEVRGVPARPLAARRPEPRHPVDVQRARRSGTIAGRRRTLAEAESVPGGLLGADYAIENGRYRFTKVFGGLNWNPELRAPLTEPGVDVKAGEYLLAVDGRDLAPPENLYAGSRATAGTSSRSPSGPTPDGKGSRTVKVVPIADEAALRNRDWVEGNLRRSTRRPTGAWPTSTSRTPPLGHKYFNRYFFPQAAGRRSSWTSASTAAEGGRLLPRHPAPPADRYWTTRYGADLRTPPASIQGPKVMIIDETAGSGGDLLPWMFPSSDGDPRRPAHLGRAGRHPRIPGADGRRASPRRTSPSGRRERLGGREQRRAARHRGRADAGRRDRREGPAARQGHRGRDEGAGEESAGQPKRPAFR